MKSALFVDFDNVYSGLKKLDPAIADRFARQPTQWIEWLTQSLGLPDHSPEGARRRLLVRRCYLNPAVYPQFRAAFNVAGFEIIDCPALTSGGKTSTDIHMVLDIIDLLQHETHYDEFIVFSADADFTPVLRKLRRWDRRTTVLAIGFPSAAYRASADLLIDQDEFVRNALGFKDEDEPPITESVAAPPKPASDASTLSAAARVLVEEAVRESAVAVPMAKVAAHILDTLEGMDASTWAGHGSFRGLIESWDADSVRFTTAGGGVIYDPRRHTAPTATPVNSAKPLARDTDSVIEAIRKEVARSSTVVPCSRLAKHLTEHFSTIAADWNGKGSFRKYVEGLDLAPLCFDWTSGGGVIYDPTRPEARTRNGNGTTDWGNDRDIFVVATQIHEVSDAPLLRPNDYRALFSIIEQDTRSHPFDLKETGKRVRDGLRERGLGGSRVDVNWVLRGLLMRGHVFGEGQDDAETLAMKTADNVRSLCLREQMILDKTTEAAIARWLGTSRDARRTGQ